MASVWVIAHDAKFPSRELVTVSQYWNCGAHSFIADLNMASRYDEQTGAFLAAEAISNLTGASVRVEERDAETGAPVDRTPQGLQTRCADGETPAKGSKGGGFGWTPTGDYFAYPQYVNFASIAERPGFVRVTVRGKESRAGESAYVTCGESITIDVPVTEFQALADDVLVDCLTVPVPPPPPAPREVPPP